MPITETIHNLITCKHVQKVKKAKLIILSLSFIVLYAIFIIAVFIVVVTANDVSETDSNPGHPFCLRVKQNDHIDCGPPAFVVDDLMNEVLDSEYKRVKTADIKRRKDNPFIRPKVSNSDAVLVTKPMAKLLGNEIEQKNGSSKLTPIANWCYDAELVRRGGFERCGAYFYNGRLVAPVTGIYIAYSFVEFYESCLEDGTPLIEDLTTPIEHAIYKYSVKDNKNVQIAKSIQPHKKAKPYSYVNIYKSYISTVLDLYAGDELSVKATNISTLYYARDNYFGLILFQ